MFLVHNLERSEDSGGKDGISKEGSKMAFQVGHMERDELLAKSEWIMDTYVSYVQDKDEEVLSDAGSKQSFRI